MVGSACARTMSAFGPCVGEQVWGSQLVSVGAAQNGVAVSHERQLHRTLSAPERSRPSHFLGGEKKSIDKSEHVRESANIQ